MYKNQIDFKSKKQIKTKRKKTNNQNNKKKKNKQKKKRSKTNKTSKNKYLQKQTKTIKKISVIHVFFKKWNMSPLFKPFANDVAITWGTCYEGSRNVIGKYYGIKLTCYMFNNYLIKNKLGEHLSVLIP